MCPKGRTSSAEAFVAHRTESLVALKATARHPLPLGKNLIRAALNLHTGVAQTFRKTAVNFHYEFNIRHLTRVFTGLLGSRPEQFKDPDKFDMQAAKTRLLQHRGRPLVRPRIKFIDSCLSSLKVWT